MLIERPQNAYYPRPNSPNRHNSSIRLYYVCNEFVTRTLPPLKYGGMLQRPGKALTIYGNYAIIERYCIMTTENTKDIIWDYLVENLIATEDELRLVTNINGYSVESLEDVIYAKTGYRSLDQLQECE